MCRISDESVLIRNFLCNGRKLCDARQIAPYIKNIFYSCKDVEPDVEKWFPDGSISLLIKEVFEEISIHVLNCIIPDIKRPFLQVTINGNLKIKLEVTGIEEFKDNFKVKKFLLEIF